MHPLKDEGYRHVLLYKNKQCCFNIFWFSYMYASIYKTENWNCTFSSPWESSCSKHDMNTCGACSFSSKTICIHILCGPDKNSFPWWCGRVIPLRQPEQSSELGGLTSGSNALHSDVWIPAHLGPYGYILNTKTKLMTFIYTYGDIFLYAEENHQHIFLKVKSLCIIYFTAQNGYPLI